MKRISCLALISICLVFLTNTKCFSQIEPNKFSKEKNYIPYFLEVQKAKRLSNEGKIKESFLKLDSLFDYYEPKETPLIYESKLYCELSDSLKIYKKERIRDLIISMVSNHGRNLTDYKKIGSKWKRIIYKVGLNESEINAMYINLQTNINTAVRDTIGVMYERDQWARATQERIETKLDSIDKINEPIIVDIVKKYGYPNERLLGFKDFYNPARDSHISVLLTHIDPKIKIEVIEPILINELQNGNFSPIFYAVFIDHIKMISQVDSPYPYYGSYVTNKTIQSIENLDEINKNRKSIGLLELKK